MISPEPDAPLYYYEDELSYFHHRTQFFCTNVLKTALRPPYFDNLLANFAIQVFHLRCIPSQQFTLPTHVGSAFLKLFLTVQTSLTPWCQETQTWINLLQTILVSDVERQKNKYKMQPSGWDFPVCLPSVYLVLSASVLLKTLPRHVRPTAFQ